MWNTRYFEINEHEIESERLPEHFAGFSIMQISDLHDKEYGADNELLLAAIRAHRTDIFVVTGDLYDHEERVALHLMSELVKLGPTYYCTGNHEARVEPAYLAVEAEMRKLGVHVLRNEAEVIERGNDRLIIAGVDDPEFYLKTIDDSVVINDEIQEALAMVKPGFTVLLSHRPELFADYVANHIDVVFSGHAHGGQIRLPFKPFKEGIASVNQGLAPKYTAGIHTMNQTNMVVSRGLTNHVWLPRIMNPAELVIVRLQIKKVAE
ncbi:metallophosphoesterase [Culicoidibacter larvae]|nr:metallophosphoesterase [Culicoidibacter larvae]